ncbi:unnamed protein product [Microthlaspi erraticum]|uniref:Reverse transcriptase domain-containing protein n=1 Tax=Microthlaspi erraticum TaxID=1685480 RepID=A0A6D2KLQ1_9BRAS|nr:unnamed protein product [Microthlaspi erraticum]
MRTKAAHDKLIRLKDFKVGDSVLLYNSKLRLFPGKLRSKWAGPFKIHEVLPYGAGFRKKWQLEAQLDRVKSKLDRAKFGGANSSSIELGVKTRKVVFWSILEHMGHEEHGGTWHMEAAQLDTQRKKGEAILKTSSTVYSTNRSSSSTRPAKLQLDRAGSQSQTRKMLLPP